MKYKLNEFLKLLDSDKIYEVPADIFSHVREHLNGSEAAVKLLDIENYWTTRNKTTLFEFGNEHANCRVWNKEKLEWEYKSVTNIFATNESIEAFDPQT